MAAKLQTKNWSVPVHKGAVKALKEAGAWSDDQEEHNNELLKRQEMLAAAWADLQQGQSAVRREGLPRRLDEGARRRADQGRNAERLLNAAAADSASDRRRYTDLDGTTHVTCCHRCIVADPTKASFDDPHAAQRT